MCAECVWADVVGELGGGEQERDCCCGPIPSPSPRRIQKTTGLMLLCFIVLHLVDYDKIQYEHPSKDITRRKKRQK